MGVAKVTRNYQVTIPKDVRLTQDIQIGDSIVFSIEGDKVELIKLREDILDKAFGSWKNTQESGTDYVRRIRKEWEQRENRWKER